MKKYLFIIATLFFLPMGVFAQSTTIDITTNNKNISVRDNITVNVTINSDTSIGNYEYTLDYDNSKLKLLNDNPYTMDKPDTNNIKKVTKSYKFKALTKGTSKVSVKSYAVSSYEKNKNLSVKVNSLTVNISEKENNSSSSNYLSSLEVEGYSLSPSFNKENTDYILKINKDIDSINVKAKAEDNNATVKGTGKRSISEGENRIEVIVTDSKGNELTYNILVILSDENSIKVNVNNEEFTVVKNIDSLDIPDGYKVIKIKLGDNTVKSLYNDTTKYTLLALKDKDNNISFYIYDSSDDSYTPYNEIKFDEMLFLPLETKDTLNNYKKYNETINNIDVECLKISSSSNYCVIYGMNLKTGDKGWYTYDSKENTLQKYNSDVEDYFKEKIDNSKVLIYILSGTTLLFGISTIVIAIKRQKRK